MPATMTQKRKRGRPVIPADQKPDMVPLFVEVPRKLKERLQSLAEKHRRKLNGEVIWALELYAGEQEAEQQGGEK